MAKEKLRTIKEKDAEKVLKVARALASALSVKWRDIPEIFAER